MAIQPLFESIGPTDLVTSCDCCGRTDLKSTVELLHIASGQHVWFGRECASGATHPWARLSPKYAQFVFADEGEPQDD